MDEEIQSLGTAKENEGLVKTMIEKLDSISESPPPFHICRVPATIRAGNHVYYKPKIVSIGPFHRRKRNLRAMEEHKWRYLHKVLDHCTSKPALLEKCVEEMKKIEGKARKCYSGNINMRSKGDDEFVKMLLLDGSFIIQLLLLRKKIEENDLKENERNEPLLCNLWMFSAIARDMLLLENQLPFCVLECLANCIGRPAALKKEALQFFSFSLPGNLNFKQSAKYETLVPPHEIHHLLHLVHGSLKLAPPPKEPFCAQNLQAVKKILSFQSLSCLATNKHEDELQEAGASSITIQPGASSSITVQPGASSITVQPGETKVSAITQKPFLQFFRRVICLADTKNKSSSQLNSIPTATELEEAGVVFKRNKEGSLLDVTFKNGVMRVPRLQISDDTNSLFRNIIAFEQCFPGNGDDFTSYCIFMDSLVNTPRDVQILKQSNTIDNMLGSDEEVARLFNQICKEIAGSLDTGSIGSACKEVKAYAETRWHKWRARLMHDYFSHPWAVISLIAAVYVIFLTSVQTYYAAF